MSLFVNANSLRMWAGQIDARYKLPHVIRRLVVGTVKSLHELDFPTDESTGRTGFDGAITCDIGNAWVPDNHSFWEMGVSNDPKAKATEDFKKRTSSTPEDVQAQSTYVFVTPRYWKDKDQWISKQAGVGKWKEVRAYDCDDLEQWFEVAPAVATWFATHITRNRPDGVDDVESHWESISLLSAHPLPPDIFLCGRLHNIEKLRDWLSGPAGVLELKSRSPSEVVDFFVAYVASLKESERTAMASRSVIVQDIYAWRTLRDSTVPLLLVVDHSLPLEPQEVSRAIRNGHHVLLASESLIRLRASSEELARAKQHLLAEKLEEAGYAPAVARQAARASGGSLSILKRQLSLHPSTWRNKWSESAGSDVIAACLLLGGWSSKNDSDKAAFELLVGKPFHQCEQELNALATCRDPMLLNAAGNWRVISKEDAWSSAADTVTTSSVQCFEGLAIAVFLDDNPRFDLQGDERAFAQIHGHVPEFSETLKQQVGETLAFLGSHADGLNVTALSGITRVIDSVIMKVLPTGTTWERWASLGSILQLLAEAGPDSFIHALRTNLFASDGQFRELMADEGGWFGRCNHAGILWALETLAWSPKYLFDACSLLFRLSAIDDGGRSLNRPINSLAGILSCWMPYTNSSLDDRIRALDMLIQQDQYEVWSLLLLLMPEKHAYSNPTQLPYWRDWANVWDRGVTYAEMHQAFNATAERLVGQVGVDVQRWNDLFGRLHQFPQCVHAALVHAAMRFVEGGLSGAESRQLSETLSTSLHRYREDYKGDNALPESLLIAFDDVLAKIQPADPVLKHAWLFEGWPEKFYNPAIGAEEGGKRLAEERSNAMNEIVLTKGLEGVVAMAEQVKHADVVGRVFAAVTRDKFLSEVIPSLLEGEGQTVVLAMGFVVARFYEDGFDWFDSALENCESDSTKAWMLSCLPFEPRVSERVKSQTDPVQHLYWSRAHALYSLINNEECQYVVDQLIEAGRANDALDIVVMALYEKRSLPDGLLFQVVESLTGEDIDKQNNGYHIKKVIEELQSREYSEKARVGLLELRYAPLFNEHQGEYAKTLHTQLARSPNDYVDALCLLYRPKNRDPEDTVNDENARAVAVNLFRVLLTWKCVPGTTDSGTVDAAALRDWCDEVRKLAKEADRLEVCDVHIGKVFAHAPTDSDGTWPCEAVRQVAESIGTDSLASGLRCAIRNSRGVVGRQSGGDQERELAKQYEDKASKIRVLSPFLAKVLVEVAQGYRNDASRWDEEDRWDDR